MGTCSQNPDDGDDINFAEMDPTLQNSGYFSKKISLGYFDGSLSGSAKSITANLQNQGVKLYRVIVDPHAECRYFYFLNRPTVLSMASWNEMSEKGKTKDCETKDCDKKFQLVGHFSSNYFKEANSPAWTIVNSRIMVRHDTQKWTLLHEQGHYLFAIARGLDPNMPTNDELKARIQKGSDTILAQKSKYQAEPSTKLAMDIINSYRDFYQNNLEFSKRGPLEEFAVDSMLVERVQQNKINFINRQLDVANAFEYMLANSAGVSIAFRDMTVRLKELKEDVFVNESASVGAKIDDLIKDIETLLEFIDDKLENAYNEKYSLLAFDALPLHHALMVPSVEKGDHHDHSEDVNFQIKLIRGL